METLTRAWAAEFGSPGVRLGQIKAKLDAAGQDPTKLQALSDALDAQAAKLSQAVTDNTPAA